MIVPHIYSHKDILVQNYLLRNLNEVGAQCFPRWRYPKPANTNQVTSGDQPSRIDKISDTALRAFQEHYNDKTITKDYIFDYVYRVLHAPSSREQFANDLSKMIPHSLSMPRYVNDGCSRLCKRDGRRLIIVLVNGTLTDFCPFQ